MDTRVTLQSQANESILYLQRQSDQLANIEEQATTGNRINQPSDDPLDIPTVMLGQAQDNQYSAYLNNISSAQAVLNQSVSSLTSVTNVLTSATQLASQGANGSNDQSTMDTLAQQVNAQINQLLSIANTQSSGSYLFGGTATNTTPFTVASTNAQGEPETISYNGANNSSEVLIGPGQTVSTYAPGNQVFQAPGADAFQALIGLRNALENTSGLDSSQQVQAISQQIGALQNASNAVNNTVGEQSNGLQNLNSVQTQVQNLQVQTKELVSNVQSADPSQVLVQFQAQENAFEMTLSVTAQMFSQNLLTFLQSAG